MSQGLNHENFLIVAIDQNSVRVAESVNLLHTLIVLSTAGEDPSCWNDLVVIWPRYASPPTTSADLRRLTWFRMKSDDMLRRLHSAEAWIVIDMVSRRLLSNVHLADHIAAATGCEGLTKTSRVTLAPWWEFIQEAAPATVSAPRSSPLQLPNPAREILWGSPLFRFFASAIINLAVELQSKPIPLPGGNRAEQRPFRQLSVIHRDWLMSPCLELNGGKPRDCLHIARLWIDVLVFRQTLRSDSNLDLVPLHPRMSTQQNAPPGTSEVVLYFEACRFLLARGWVWTEEYSHLLTNPNAVRMLTRYLRLSLNDWRKQKSDGPYTHQQIIDAERSRVPILLTPAEQVIDCDCPICQMMAEEQTKPTPLLVDSSWLEAEQEFAFSLAATYEEWSEDLQSDLPDDPEDDDENEPGDDERESDRTNSPETTREPVGSAGIDNSEGDSLLKGFGSGRSPIPSKRMIREIASTRRSQAGPAESETSVWKNTMIRDEDFPGDPAGHLRLAFRLAEVVGVLQEKGSSHRLIDQLNGAFRQYRKAASPTELASATDHFRFVLEEAASQHSELVDRVADLQSWIDEYQRQT